MLIASASVASVSSSFHASNFEASFRRGAGAVSGRLLLATPRSRATLDGVLGALAGRGAVPGRHFERGVSAPPREVDHCRVFGPAYGLLCLGELELGVVGWVWMS